VSLAIVLLALADGVRRIVWEELLALSVKSTKMFESAPGLTISVFSIPIQLATFVTIFVSGFLAQAVGYAGVFLLSIGTNVAFMYLTGREMA
jgi:hypothetical protein